MVRRWRSHLLKERQLYYRANGDVHFVALSPRAQIAAAAVTLLVLSWIGYSTVNVIFHRQILNAKNARIAELRADYETRLAEAKRDTDAVAALLVESEDRFSRFVEAIDSHQQDVDARFERRMALGASFEAVEAAAASGAPQGGRTAPSKLMIDPTPSEPTPRRSPPLATPTAGAAAQEASAAPSYYALSANGERLVRAAQARLGWQTAALDRLERDLATQAGVLRRSIRAMKLDPETIAAIGAGGPFVPAGTGEDFDAPLDIGAAPDIDRFEGRFWELERLSDFIERTPLASPIAPPYRVSDNYGYRRDPIHGRRARHFGVDYGARLNAPILAAAPGRVVRAGPLGSYGLLVEIDHGNGFATRYAHLRKIMVRKGDYVAFQQQIGLMGSTGRATGPHLHYEVLYEGRHRNPALLFEAARHVFQE